jgi:O-antigen/teichoic acid export membrane protein
MGIRRSIILSALTQYGQQAIMFGATLIVVRLLTPAEMGVFAVAMGVIGLLATIRTMGVPLYFISLPTVSTDDLRLYAGLSWLLGFVFAALLVALSWSAGSFYGNPQIGMTLRVLAIAHGLNSIGSAPGLLLLREMRFGAMLWVGLAATTVQAVVVISLAVSGAGPLSLAWAQVATNLTASFGNALCVPALIGLRPTLRGWRRAVGFSGWMTACAIVGNFNGQAAELVTGRVLGLASTALYSRALSLANVIRTLFYGTTSQPALPAFVQAEREEKDGIVPVYLRFVAVITGLSWPAYAALAIWAEPITVLLYGEQWRASAALLPAICFANVLFLSAIPYDVALIAARRARVFFVCDASLLLCWLALLLIATHQGLRAVAWAYVLASGIGTTIFIAALRRAIGLRLRDLAVVWWRSGVPALAAAAVAALVRVSPIATAWPLPLVLILTGCLGGMAWLGAIWLVRHEFRDHATELLRWGWAKLQPARP